MIHVDFNITLFFTIILKSFVSLFAILNPFGAIPVFVSLTQNYSKNDRQYVIRHSSYFVFGILTFFLLFGELLFKIFGIDIGSLEVAGGILLSLVSLNMVFGNPHKERTSKDELAEAEDKENIALVPLARPLLSGPGAIATVVTLSTSLKNNYIFYIAIVIAIILACVGVFAVLSSSIHLNKLLGKTGIGIISRLMGIILLAISVQFVVNGLKVLFPLFLR
jgi:multiple antibiotic resistance protein